MPLQLHKHIENGEIGLWKISEEPEELLLLANLSSADKITCSGITTLHRKKEWLATRALLNEMTLLAGPINYYEDGRPYLEQGKYNISISHTKGFAAIFLHETLIPGIDIELTSRLVGKVASRFLSPEEFEMCHAIPELTTKRVLLVWCAKEAIFKIVPFTNIEFSTDIKITLNDTTDNFGSFPGVYVGPLEQIPVELEYLDKNGVILVWGCIKPGQDARYNFINSF